MEKTLNYMKKLLESKGITIDSKHTQLLGDVCSTSEIQESVNSIISIQDKMVNTWARQSKIHDFIHSAFSIPNATVGKPYNYQFDTLNVVLKGIRILNIEAPSLDIQYDQESKSFSAVFSEPGQFKIAIKFKLEEDAEDSLVGTKEVKLLVNPDPKSLWKNLDSNKEDPYWKEDNVSASAIFGNKNLIIGSKRGRSHAHEGIFRDDDFGYHFLEETGWGIIAVADGAGSAKFSRKGSLLACNSITDYFKSIPTEEWDLLSDSIIGELHESKAENQRAISSFCIKNLGKAAFGALNAIKAEADSKEAMVKDYSTTLIFALVKEFDDKLFITSFWVGDGGIGIFSKEPNTVSLLGVPDSGEFSGQTRFLTMGEIFSDNAYISRIKYKIVDKSAKLILMTDGITDAKFQTDAALEKIDVWNSFLDDLEGTNEDSIAVDFDADIKVSEENLMKWMDFWSPGNHDDRTIAILY
jgi:serine/threonine protein phosphatase PrpC